MEGATMTRANLRASARSQVLARNAVSDGALGAALGLLVVSGLVACNLGLRDGMAQSGQPLSSLASLVAVVVAQAAVVASLCGAALRKFSAND
jgi:hypothetical protein